MLPLEYLAFFGELQGMTVAASLKRGEQLLKQFGLWDAREKRLDSYSKGMKQKVALIRALIHDPPVLYLDEPTTAMDPHSARIVRDAIDEMRAAHRTILLTTHNLNEAETLADRIVIVRSGEIIAEGTHTQLTRQLMGVPIWELTLASPAAQAVPFFDGLAHVEQQGPDWLHYRCADPQAINPQLLSRLTAQGIPVVGLAALPRRLEDVYLSIIADDAERGVWSQEREAKSQESGVRSQESGVRNEKPGAELIG
jgi:ABC-2 type transport system ATP-binding protein